MSNKRTAAKELNANNWDQVDEPEEAGTFSVASDEELQRRVVRTAKRRANLTSNNDEPKKGVFSNFSGFGKTPSTLSTSFNFLSNLANVANGKMDPVKSTDIKISTSPKEIPKLMNIPKQEEKNTPNINHSEEYCSNLKNLNESVYEWIKSHLEKNPYCILTPIFDDYKKYLKDFDKFKTESSINPPATLTSTEKSESKALDPFSIKSKDSVSNATQFPMSHNTNQDSPRSTEKVNITKFNTPTTNMFSQGFSSTPVTKAPMFSFGQQSSTTTTTSSSFSFGTAKPFSFGNVNQEEKKSDPQAIDENEDEEPPKVTFTPVIEEDSVFSKRCKVFVKNQDSFGDRGVGTLYLKPISGSEKYQLIVRADTSLGNLLLNMVLSVSIPTKRMGKNNVMLVSIPTPEAKPPPVPMLLRVKTSEEADELLATLEKYKK